MAAPLPTPWPLASALAVPPSSLALMATTPSMFHSTGLALCSGLALCGLASLTGGPAALAQQSGYGQTLDTTGSPQPRDAFNGPGGQQSILDATNPLDLMNRIRRGTALEDATPPSSAIDSALRDFEAQIPAADPEVPASSAVPPSSLPASQGLPNQDL